MLFSETLLPFRVSLWMDARLLPIFVKGRELRDLLEKARGLPNPRWQKKLGLEEIIASTKQVSSRPWLMRKQRCLREGLLAFHYLSCAGYQPKIHFGVLPKSFKSIKPDAHCWISLDDQVVLNPPEPDTVEMFAFDGCNNIVNSPRSDLSVTGHE